jgi:hypothetical protein
VAPGGYGLIRPFDYTSIVKPCFSATALINREYLFCAGLLYAQASLVKVYDHRDEHRCLRDPWLADGNLGYARAAVGVADDRQRYLVAVGRSRSPAG